MKSLRRPFLKALLFCFILPGAYVSADNYKQQAESLVKTLEQKYLSSEPSSFVVAIENGKASTESLQAFALEQRLINMSDLRSNALSLHRFGADPSENTRTYFIRLIIGEAQANEQIPSLIQALKISQDDIAEYAPIPKAQAYPSYTAWLANYAEPAQIAAALLINFQSFGNKTGRVAKGLKRHQGFNDQQVAFLTGFSELPMGFKEQTIRVIAEGLASGTTAAEIENCVRLIQAYESDFWQAFNPQN